MSTTQDDALNKIDTTISNFHEEIDTIHIDPNEFYYDIKEDNSFDSYFDNVDTSNIKTTKIKKRKTTVKPLTTKNEAEVEMTTKNQFLTEEMTTHNSIQIPSPLKETEQTSNQDNANKDKDKESETVNGNLKFFWRIHIREQKL